MGGKRITTSIIDYMIKAAGPVTLDRMARDLRLEHRQIQQALSHAIRGEERLPIEVIQRGQIWRWNGSTQKKAPEQQPTETQPDGLAVGDMLEVIGVTQSGDVVGRDVTGALYRVRPL